LFIKKPAGEHFEGLSHCEGVIYNSTSVFISSGAFK